MSGLGLDAISLASKIRRRELTASRAIEVTLRRIHQINPRINAFTAVLTEPAMQAARHIDDLIAGGHDAGVLAGVPFAVKNLFDIAGTTTIAGSKMRCVDAPATHDATIISRLRAAGAVLVGALNMDEFAYGLTTENTHYGPTRNPHDPARTAGGSSGGSAAAVAADLVPFSLGTDTAGSIRVPASLCGVFGLKPSFGRLPRTGTTLFVPSIDHVGPFAKSVRDLSLIYDLMQGHDPADPSCAMLPLTPTYDRLAGGIGTLRIAVAGGYFRTWTTPEAREAVDRAASALGVDQEIELPRPDLARAAAYVIGAVEGAALHLDDLRDRLEQFDPITRGRFVAGALLPSAWYVKARQFRRWLDDELDRVFSKVDIILAPTTPCTATPLGLEKMELAGQTVMTRPSLGLLTQPFSATRVAIVSVPLKATNGMPIGVQVITPPYREDLALRVASALETAGVARAQISSD